MNQETENSAQTQYVNQGCIAFYHANGKGTGAALRFEFKPPTGRRNGFFFMEMATQRSVGAGTRSERTPATFDWENKATVKLSFMDVCECLAVLRLKQTGLGVNDRGLYHVNGNVDTLITLRPGSERPGFSFGISRRDKQGHQLFKGYFMLSPTETIGLDAIFSASLFFMAFGQPQAVAA